jgi:hypothetical protein
MGSGSWDIKFGEEIQGKSVELGTRRELIFDDGLNIKFLPPLDM